jgi:hypothetical protein
MSRQLIQDKRPDPISADIRALILRIKGMNFGKIDETLNKIDTRTENQHIMSSCPDYQPQRPRVSPQERQQQEPVVESQRFKPDIGTATRRLIEGRLTVKDVTQDNNAVEVFVQKKLRYARAAEILAPDNANWAGAMLMIYDQMDTEIKHFLPAPDQYDTFEDYMKVIEKSKSLLLQADNLHLFLTGKKDCSTQYYDSLIQNDQYHNKYNRSANQRDQSNRNKRSSATFEKYNSQDQRDRNFKGHDREFYKKRQSNENDRSRERRAEGDRSQADKPIIANGRSDYHLRKPKSNDRAYLVESSEEADDETSSQQSKSDTQSEAGHFVGERVVSKEEHKH